MKMILILIVLISGKAHAEVVIDMNAIMTIESHGDASITNKRSGARGLYQITPICLEDFNKVNHTNYSLNQLYDPQINSMVAYWYLQERIPSLFKAYNLPDTVRNRLWAYNAGIGYLKRRIMPLETSDYIKKYERLTKWTTQNK
jgi:soluble lytic murein transglycosylase-like protein